MKVLKLTSLEAGKQLDGYKTKSGNRLELSFDGNGDLILGKSVLTDPEFSEVCDLIVENTIEIDYITTEGKEEELALIEDKFQNLKN